MDNYEYWQEDWNDDAEMQQLEHEEEDRCNMALAENRLFNQVYYYTNKEKIDGIP